MQRIGIVGLSWRQGGPEALARFTIPVDQREERLPALREAVGADEIVYLATCNRVELLFVADAHVPLRAYRPRIFEALAGRRPEPGEAPRALRAWAGEGAVEHLFCVASGLDSARVGETEVTGQVREAWHLAQRAGVSGPRCDLVMQEGLRVAAAVHKATSIAEGRTSLAEIAIEKAKERLYRTPGRLAVVGVSPMTMRCARTLAEHQYRIVVVNRSADRALGLAGEIGGIGRSLEDFRRNPDPVEVLVLATGAKTAVLGRATLERLAARTPSGEPPLLIDMAVPPDVDPADAAACALPRLGMAEIIAEAEIHRDQRVHAAADARDMIDEALLEFRQKMIEWELSPMLGALQRRYRQTAVEGVERLLAKTLPGLDDAQREAVEAWAVTLARRFAHVPSLGLRAVAMHKGLDAIDTFFSNADRTLAKEWENVRQSGRASRGQKNGRSSQEPPSLDGAPSDDETHECAGTPHTNGHAQSTTLDEKADPATPTEPSSGDH